MLRTVATALVAAGLVATGAGPSFAGKPSAPAPDFVLNASIGPISTGYCWITVSAAFTSAPTTMPTAWAFNFDEVGRDYDQVWQSQAALDGTFYTTYVGISPGHTVTATVAPVYGKKQGTAVQRSFTCVA